MIPPTTGEPESQHLGLGLYWTRRQGWAECMCGGWSMMWTTVTAAESEFAEHATKAHGGRTNRRTMKAADRLNWYVDIGFPVRSVDGAVTLSVEQLRFAAELIDKDVTE